MKRIETGLSGLVVLEPVVHADPRGYFLETFNERTFAALGLPTRFPQDNLSRSTRGTLRGLHFQKPNPQGKLVRCTRGAVYDVAVDIRPSSPTFGRWFGVELSEQNRLAMYVPPGFGHGFHVLSEEAHFHYKCTDFYSPGDDGGLRWDDPELGIDWRLSGAPLLSERDRAHPPLDALRRSGRLDGW